MVQMVQMVQGRHRRMCGQLWSAVVSLSPPSAEGSAPDPVWNTIYFSRACATSKLRQTFENSRRSCRRLKRLHTSTFSVKSHNLQSQNGCRNCQDHFRLVELYLNMEHMEPEEGEQWWHPVDKPLPNSPEKQLSL